MFTPYLVLLFAFSIFAHQSTPGPDSGRVPEVFQSYLSLLAWIPAYLLHLFPPLQAGVAQIESCGAVLWCVSLCLCTHIFSGRMLSLCWMMVYSALCAPLWFHNEDFVILNTLTLETCCTFQHVVFSTSGKFSEDVSCLHNKLMMITVFYQGGNSSNICCPGS